LIICFLVSGSEDRLPKWPSADACPIFLSHGVPKCPSHFRCGVVETPRAAALFLARCTLASALNKCFLSHFCEPAAWPPLGLSLRRLIRFLRVPSRLPRQVLLDRAFPRPGAVISRVKVSYGEEFRPLIFKADSLAVRPYVYCLGTPSPPPLIRSRG